MTDVIYMLDTDTLVAMVRGLKSGRQPAHRRRAEGLVERCRQTQKNADAVGLSAITVSELEFGARKSGRYDTEVVAVRKLLTPFEIFAYDAVSSPVHYGRVRHELEARGIAIGAMDLLIAAHAVALDATLVTNNLSHFSRVVGLKTANWLTAA